ncbi:hypothetical protein [Galbibacter pacificus]|uniref:Uncharacterized protein n=1 Tax=Galbibacter pacificus TaxID=2996052 RepID=A0ABT6FRN2_9FLAO|nr:hypothetical protein [Galbibacter pacificus]MDG3582953.1 hypothetical protein [Galbibacter pacificus]MDG3585928.1 hypothetical protein [Galbibacter pacificus]
MTGKKITMKQLIKLIDTCIENMATKRVYYPRRLKTKWISLIDDSDKLVMFEEYLSKKTISIGLDKLMSVDLCHKTLEAVLLENLGVLGWLSKKEILQNCINKLSKHENGRMYLKANGYCIDN